LIPSISTFGNCWYSLSLASQERLEFSDPIAACYPDSIEKKLNELAPHAYPQKDSEVERCSLLPHRAPLPIKDRGIPSGRSLLAPCQSGSAHLQSSARPARLGALAQVARPQKDSVVRRTIALTSPLAPLPRPPLSLSGTTKEAFAPAFVPSVDSIVSART
jgi:hypothetical protein